MKTNEKRNEPGETADSWSKMSCCGMDSNSSGMPDCCAGFFGNSDRSSMISKCMTICRWFLLLPVIIGVAVLLLGYYIDSSITRILCMYAAGFIVLMGVFGLILAGRMKSIYRSKEQKNQML